MHRHTGTGSCVAPPPRQSPLYCYYGPCQQSLVMQSQVVRQGAGRVCTKPAASVHAAACAPRPFTPARSRSHSHASRTHGRTVAARSQAENQFDVDTGSAEQLPVELGPRPDDILPDSLADAVSQVRKEGTASKISGNRMPTFVTCNWWHDIGSMHHSS